MYHSFDKITINDIVCPVQDGTVRVRVTYIVFWIGTNPTPEELEDRCDLDIEIGRILFRGDDLITSITTILKPEELQFHITTHQGCTFSGKGFLSSYIEECYAGRTMVVVNPTIICNQYNAVCSHE